MMQGDGRHDVMVMMLILRGILPSNSMLPTMVFPHEYCIFI